MKIKVSFLLIVPILLSFCACTASDKMDVHIFIENFNRSAEDPKIIMEDMMSFEEDGAMKHSYIVHGTDGEAKHLISMQTSRNSAELISCTLTTDKMDDEESAKELFMLASRITNAFSGFNDKTLEKLNELELLNPSTFPELGSKEVNNGKYTMRLTIMDVGLTFYIEKSI